MYLTVPDDRATRWLTFSRGLTAYNHNLDTSREHYPKACLL